MRPVGRIEHELPRAEQLDRQRRCIGGLQSQRGAVDDDGIRGKAWALARAGARIGQGGGEGLAFGGIAVDDAELAAPRGEAGGGDRPGGTASTEQADRSPGDAMATAFPQGCEEALPVGGVTGPALGGGHEGVHGFRPPGVVGKFGYQRERLDFMGHRQVQAREAQFTQARQGRGEFRGGDVQAQVAERREVRVGRA